MGENFHIFREMQVQISLRIHFEENLTRSIYHTMLEETTAPFITYKKETQADAERNLVLQQKPLHFQQDGSPPHYYLTVRKQVKREIPE